MSCEQSMDAAVVIPAKGFSSRVPRKNMRLWKGRPLIAWSIGHALREGFTPHVVTDDAQITECSSRLGASVIEEPQCLVSKESRDVMRWFARRLRSDAVVLLQPTSPIRRSGLIGDCLAKLGEGFDSVYTGARLPSYLVHDSTGRVTNLPRKEDGSFPSSDEAGPQYLRTGSVCAVRRDELCRTEGDLLTGKVGVVEVSLGTAVDIDYPEDLRGAQPQACVVGSAYSLRNKSLGRSIDSHANVVRVNMPMLKGFEQDVGRKWTHWATAHPSESVSCSGIQEVWLARQRWGHLADVATTTPGYQPFRIFNRLPGATVMVLLCRNPRLPPNLNGQDVGDFVERPTAGLLAVRTALSRWSAPINIAGFGDRGVSRPGYYWTGVAAGRKWHSGSHDFDAERQLLNRWEKRGLVVRLDAEDG